MTPSQVSYRPANRERNRPMSPDTGWAWMVLLATHLSMALSIGYFTTLGIFYIEWKDYFQTSATASSWLVSIPLLVASPLSLFSGSIAARLGIRRVTMVGAAINGLATILGSFTSDIHQLYLCGALSGVGATLMVTPSMLMLAKYFKKRYAFANGIAVLGANLSQLAFPPLFRVLISHYGWRGAMFVIGAIQMNGVAVCALFRPVEIRQDEVTVPLQDGHLEMTELNNEMQTIEAPRPDDSPDHSKLLKYFGFLKIFTNIPVVLTLLVTALYSMAWILNVVHLPARCKEAGWSDDQSAMLIFVFAITSIITRGGHGWFVDRKIIGPFKLQLIGLFVAALVTFFNPISDSYVFLVIYSSVIGAFLGMVSPLLIVNIKSLARPTQIPNTLSIMFADLFLFNGLGSVIAGWIFDLTGNYTATFLTGGGMFSASFILFAVVTLIKSRRDRNLRDTEI